MIKNTAYSNFRPFLFPGYVIIISVALAMMSSGLARSAFGVFFNPMADTLGWSAAQISGAFTFSMVIEGSWSLISGSLSDKFGNWKVITFSGLMAGGGFFLTSQVHSLWQMYIIYGLAMGIGLGGISVPVLSLLTKSFKTNRTLIIGIALASYGVGQLISPLLSHQLITAYDWRISYIIIGSITFLLIVLPAQFLRRSRQAHELPHQSNTPAPTAIAPDASNFTFKEARQTRTFWMMFLVFGFTGFCFSSMTVHLVPYAIGIGISSGTAAIILACYGGSVIIGRLILGSLADMVGNKRMIHISLAISIVALIWLLQAKEVWSIFIFTVIGGIGLGGISPSQSPLTARFFGLKSHGSIYGALGGGSFILASTGPFILGYLFDLTGHYQIPFLVCAFFGVIALVISFLWLKPPKKPQVKEIT